MSNKRKMSFDLPTDTPSKVIEVTVRYSKADNSYVNDRAEQQGYWVGFTPVEIDGCSRTTVAYTGVKAFVESGKRFSAKKLDQLFTHIKHAVMVGHTEDRWPRVARLVAENAELRITQ